MATTEYVRDDNIHSVGRSPVRDCRRASPTSTVLTLSATGRTNYGEWKDYFEGAERERRGDGDRTMRAFADADERDKNSRGTWHEDTVFCGLLSSSSVGHLCVGGGGSTEGGSLPGEPRAIRDFFFASNRVESVWGAVSCVQYYNCYLRSILDITHQASRADGEDFGGLQSVCFWKGSATDYYAAVLRRLMTVYQIVKHLNAEQEPVSLKTKSCIKSIE